METKISKWGNSLAIRIPHAYVKEGGFAYGTIVNLSLEKGKLVISHREDADAKLESLLAEVNDQNRHQEHDFGDAVGREIW